MYKIHTLKNQSKTLINANIFFFKTPKIFEPCLQLKRPEEHSLDPESFPGFRRKKDGRQQQPWEILNQVFHLQFSLGFGARGGVTVHCPRRWHQTMQIKTVGPEYSGAELLQLPENLLNVFCFNLDFSPQRNINIHTFSVYLRKWNQHHKVWMTHTLYFSFTLSLQKSTWFMLWMYQHFSKFNMIVFLQE